MPLEEMLFAGMFMFEQGVGGGGREVLAEVQSEGL